jgi:hypothetical protein
MRPAPLLSQVRGPRAGCFRQDTRDRRSVAYGGCELTAITTMSLSGMSSGLETPGKVIPASSLNAFWISMAYNGA